MLSRRVKRKGLRVKSSTVFLRISLILFLLLGAHVEGFVMTLAKNDQVLSTLKRNEEDKVAKAKAKTEKVSSEARVANDGLESNDLKDHSSNDLSFSTPGIAHAKRINSFSFHKQLILLEILARNTLDYYGHVRLCQLLSKTHLLIVQSWAPSHTMCIWPWDAMG